MNRMSLMLLMLFACLSACKKTDDIQAQAKAQAAIDEKVISTYLKSKGLPETHVDTTGVCYTIDTLGTGTALFTSSTQVTLGYTGSLLSTGAVFAQTDQFHPTFVLGQVIKGWQIGIPEIKQGGSITLYIPSRYAYGPYQQPQTPTAGAVNIPANSVLIFNIKLYDIIND